MIKVVQERHCKPGNEGDLKMLLDELKSKALRQNGSYSFETLKSVDDPSVWMTIVSWTFAEEWKVWQKSPQRQEIVGKIEALLAEPAKESTFELAR